MEAVFSSSARGSLKVSGITGREEAFAFNLGLSVGDISEDRPGPVREGVLRELERSMITLPGVAEHIREWVSSSSASLEALLRRRAAGEPVRIWFSEQPDELCGLCWLAGRLSGQEAGGGPVSVVKLPRWVERTDGVVVEHLGWGGVSPREWKRILPLEQPLCPIPLRAAANRWRELQEENAPLRAVVNGRLSSVAEDFYDSFLRRELARMPEEFREAALIGEVLGRCRLGIGDGLLAGRIEAMIAAGELEALTAAAEGEPAYRRVLRKRGPV